MFHGFLNFDKPAGLSSRAVVNLVAALARRTKVGHAGTLDPLATGVLVVCFGAATRLVSRVQEHSKGYRAGLKLGVRSDTDDVTGTVIPGGDASRISDDEIRAALAEFQGTIAQVPPRFSAVHVAGQRAYELARAEAEFALTPREVQVDSVQLAGRSGDELLLEIVCGSGTYVRSLIRDLGDRLGCGAVMTSLQRTFIGPFRVESAISLEHLTAERLHDSLQPLRMVLSDEPRYQASAAECEALQQGRSIGVSMASGKSPRIAVLGADGELFAFAGYDAAAAHLSPQQVFVRR
jgi:tRNA pseudouridine55 synthase